MAGPTGAQPHSSVARYGKFHFEESAAFQTWFGRWRISLPRTLAAVLGRYGSPAIMRPVSCLAGGPRVVERSVPGRAVVVLPGQWRENPCATSRQLRRSQRSGCTVVLFQPSPGSPAGSPFQFQFAFTFFLFYLLHTSALLDLAGRTFVHTNPYEEVPPGSEGEYYLLT